MKLKPDPSSSTSVAAGAGRSGLSLPQTLVYAALSLLMELLIQLCSEADNITGPPKNNPAKKKIVLYNHTLVVA